MIDRRSVALACAASLVSQRRALVQQPARIKRVGWIANSAPVAPEAAVLPTGHQPEDRQGAGPVNSVQREVAHRRGDRMIARRCALGGLVGSFSLLAAPLFAQQAGKVHRIGYLSSGPASSPFHQEFRKALLELGWVEGQNVAIEFRFAESRFERLPGLVAELLRLKPDVIVAQPSAAALAVKNVTTTIPIVMANAGDPVRLGLVASLARPGGNVTGTAFSVGLQTITKGLQLLKEAIPKLTSVAVLGNPANPLQADAIANLNNAARFLGVQLLPMEARSADELDTAFATMMKKRAQALLVVLDSLFVSNRARLAALALQHRLPSMYSARESVVAGGMMSYGPSLTEGTRRAALYVDKILKGAKPADLAVEQPTRFELVINLKTAKSLRLAIPHSVLLRADEVIQ
jgi:putative ABC transport system substrate-binding protein